jgi:hypothetical protein
MASPQADADADADLSEADADLSDAESRGDSLLELLHVCSPRIVASPASDSSEGVGTGSPKT